MKNNKRSLFHCSLIIFLTFSFFLIQISSASGMTYTYSYYRNWDENWNNMFFMSGRQMNSSGVQVGVCSGNNDCFYIQNGSDFNYINIPDAYASYKSSNAISGSSISINDKNEVSLLYGSNIPEYCMSFFWSDGSFHVVDAGFDTHASALNNVGQVTGSIYNFGLPYQKVFIWNADGTSILLEPGLWTLNAYDTVTVYPYSALGINDRGEILTRAQARMFDIYLIATPVPEPVTMLLLGFGLVGVVGVWRKFRSYS